jgi:glycosyltransferase involved in cell wall biosynthesis
LSSSSHPKVTIITACYNSGNYIEQTINSVIGQTYKNIQYIIVDGGSTDNTLEIIDKYKYRIDTLISERDKGVYDAFNKGVRLATGDYINFMNSDDYFSDNTVLEDVAYKFINNPELTMIHGNVKAVDEITGHFHYQGGNLCLSDLAKGMMCPHQSVFVKRNMFPKNKYFELKYTILADIDFVTKCFKSDESTIEYFDREIAISRINGISSNLNSIKKMKLEHALITLEHFGKIPQSIKRFLEMDDIDEVKNLYIVWFEILFLSRRAITRLLKKDGITNIAILGTLKAASLLKSDADNEGLKTIVFLDNNVKNEGKLLHGVEIHSLKWLEKNTSKLDAIVITVERDIDEIIISQINNFKLNYVPKIYNWRELIYRELQLNK